MDRGDTGTATKADFSSLVKGILVEWNGARQTLAGIMGASTAVRAFANFVYVIVFALSLLAVWRVDVTAFLLPIASVVLSLSFALGGSIQQVVQSFVFVVLQRTFDVGDRIRISEDNFDSMYIVVDIGALQTTLRSVWGVVHYIGNHRLAQMTIQNHRRSNAFTVRLEIHVGIRTTAAQLDGLRQRLLQYVVENDTQWKPSITMNITDLQLGPAATLRLVILATNRLSLQNAGSVYAARTQLFLAIHNAMRELNIRYAVPSTPVRFDESMRGIIQRLAPSTAQEAHE
jgi:small-conductance mechanosensitive channel